jgi:hypothetical protein
MYMANAKRRNKSPIHPITLSPSQAFERKRIIQAVEDLGAAQKRQAEKLVLRRSTDPTWQALHADPDWKRLHAELSEVKRRFAETRRKWKGRLLEELTPAERAMEYALTNQEARESRPIMLALVKVQDRYGPADPIKTPADLLESLARLDVDLPLRMKAMGFRKPEDAWVKEASTAWGIAIDLFAVNPLLPPLPMPAPRYADRIIQLRQWCLEGMRVSAGHPAVGGPSEGGRGDAPSLPAGLVTELQELRADWKRAGEQHPGLWALVAIGKHGTQHTPIEFGRGQPVHTVTGFSAWDARSGVIAEAPPPREKIKNRWVYHAESPTPKPWAYFHDDQPDPEPFVLAVQGQTSAAERYRVLAEASWRLIEHSGLAGWVGEEVARSKVLLHQDDWVRWTLLLLRLAWSGRLSKTVYAAKRVGIAEGHYISVDAPLTQGLINSAVSHVKGKKVEWIPRPGVCRDFCARLQPDLFTTSAIAVGHILGSGRPSEPIGTTSQAGPVPPVPTEPLFTHAGDFTWVVWNGKKYDFTKGNQAEAVRALWKSWEDSGRRDGCGLSEKTIGAKVDSSSSNFRLAHVFRDHVAFNTIIRSVSKGVFALFAEESPENHTS